MNKDQRKLLNGCAKRLVQLNDDLSSIVSDIEDVKNEEECKLDNMPDSLRGSSRGEEMEESIERLDEILSLLDEHEYDNAVDLLNEF